MAEIPYDFIARAYHSRMRNAAKNTLPAQHGERAMPDTWAMFCDRVKAWEPSVLGISAIEPQRFLEEARSRSLNVTAFKTPEGEVSPEERRAIDALRARCATLILDLP